FYTHPTALPQVARSSITQDLHRRDFTINTLAIRLNPDHWGELLDYYGGEADLRDGIIRVLHSLSFVDDPTRMLRAARLEVRMGFQLDPRSEELIADALPLLKRVSGERIWHELALIFREAEPERVLCRLETLGILAHIHPQLRCDRWLQKRYRILREELDPEQWHLDPADRTFLYLALMTYRLEREALHELTDRLRLTRSDADDLLLLFDLKAALPQLGKLRRPSTVHHLLEPYPSRVLAAAWVATDRRRPREYLFSYETTWRHVQPMLSGDDLMALGVPPGPIYRNLLNGLRDARLDGRVHTRDEEEALLQTLLQETVT
ncbi:MAG TPA: CCA tRNA nucleotidyltransferase, partial [Chloroflexi bacterium]|nr:CCA tRNA nucleotidyltransferase [Chloroflexota bacterium]